MMKVRTLLSLLLILGARAGAAEPRTGEQIYRQACAYCHG
jgi:mono/diheme cytochrome c family protein